MTCKVAACKDSTAIFVAMLEVVMRKSDGVDETHGI